MSEVALRLIRFICPYPYMGWDRVLRDGLLIKQPEPCKSCSPKACLHRLASGPAGSFEECTRGFTLFKADLRGVPIVINGILVRGWHGEFPRKTKKRLAGQSVSDTDVISWYESVRAMLAEVDNVIDERVSGALGVLHDVKTAVSLIFRNAEVLINEEPGRTFDEKVENAASSKKTLFKAVGLLEERLKMTSLVTNAEAASHGHRFSMPVYRIVDKIAKMFYPIANQKRVYIELRGTSYKTPLLYQSFTTIPLVLIDNAVKYSLTDQSVSIQVNDVAGGVEVGVESFSPRIYADEKTQIFEKYRRGRNAALAASSGSGLGLYLASVVADANGFSIQHEEVGAVVDLSNVEYVNNRFFFVVK